VNKLIPELTPREEVRQVLRNAGWHIDDERPDRIEASDGNRYGVAVFFEAGQPVFIEYGNGEINLQHRENWHQAPGLLMPAEVGRLFHKEGE
jgi:hypothetical protein